MGKWISKIAVCMMLILAVFATTASAASLEDRKAELRQKTTVTLDKLYAKQPKARNVIMHSAGYAVFNNTGIQLGIFGSAHGRGMAINNVTGQEVFMRMKEYQAGLGLGVKEYAVIFVFNNEAAWNSFVNSGWSYGGQATAAASDGVSGDSFDGALPVAQGVWIYQMTTKGLAAEIGIKGTNYYRDKDFDKVKK